MNIFTQLKQGVVTENTIDMIALGQQVAEALPENSVLALYGKLGVGKTTFVQGLGKLWKIKEAITSPTFNILSVYQGSRTLIHIDAYRLGGEDPHDALMLDDLLREPFCLVVEWPERFASYLLDDAIKLVFTIDKDRKHWVKLKH